jgi:AraC-like DNA-binding protein
LDWAEYWGYWVWMNQPTIYIVASALIVFYAYQAEKLLVYPSKGLTLGIGRLKRLKTIITSFKLYFAVVFLLLVGDLIYVKLTTNAYYFYFTRFYYYPFFIGISLLTYWIGIEGFRRKDLDDIAYKVALEPEKEAQLIIVTKALEKSMCERRLFKALDLSLNKTAEALQVKPYLLSQALNEILNTKFNDYLNAFRIAEVQALLLKPERASIIY